MSITFACGHCGKSFTVDDELGGKKGRCKQCNAVMSIPKAKTAPVRQAPSVPREAARPVASVMKQLAREAEPLPTRRELAEVLPARPARVTSADDSRPRAKKKRKKRPDGAGVGSMVGLIVLRVVCGLVASFVAFMITSGGFSKLRMPDFRMPSFLQSQPPGVVSKEEFEGQIKAWTSQVVEFADLLGRVQDATIAEAESARANTLIRQLGSTLIKLRDMKVRKADVDSIDKGYITTANQATERSWLERARIFTVYGATEALAIDSALAELGKIESSMPGNMAKVAPLYMPPLIPSPPPPRPGVNSRPPNFGNQPVIPPRSNSRRGTRPGR